MPLRLAHLLGASSEHEACICLRMLQRGSLDRLTPRCGEPEGA